MSTISSQLIYVSSVKYIIIILKYFKIFDTVSMVMLHSIDTDISCAFSPSLLSDSKPTHTPLQCPYRPASSHPITLNSSLAFYTNRTSYVLRFVSVFPCGIQHGFKAQYRSQTFEHCDNSITSQPLICQIQTFACGGLCAWCVSELLCRGQERLPLHQSC